MQTNNMKTITQFLEGEPIKKKFNEVLDGNGAAFVNNVFTAVKDNKLLQEASKESIYTAALMAATLNLSLDKNLGHAYIVPYKGQAQFQIGYKGLIQLCLRTNLFKTIGAAPIYEGQLIENNPLFGCVFDFSVEPEGEPIGYAASFSLLSGFEKTHYMTKKQVHDHAAKFSQSYGHRYGVWAQNFDAMSIKTVLKLLIDKYAPKSIDTAQVNTALTADQAVIKDVETLDLTYPDNEPLSLTQTIEEQEKENVATYIDLSESLGDLEMLEQKAGELQLMEMWEKKRDLILNK